MNDDAELEAQIRARDAVIEEHLHSKFEGSPLMMERGKALISRAEYDRRTLLRLLDEARAELAIQRTVNSSEYLRGRDAEILSQKFHQWPDTAARLSKAEAEIERLRAGLREVERTSHATGNEFWGALYQCGSIARRYLAPPPSETP